MSNFWVNWVNLIYYTAATFLHFLLFLHCSSLAVTLVVASDSTSPLPTSRGKKTRNSSSWSTWPWRDTKAECHLWVMILQTAQALALYAEKQEKVCSAFSAAQAPFRSSHLPRGLWICGGAFHSLETALRTKVESLGTTKCKSFFPGNSTAFNSWKSNPVLWFISLRKQILIRHGLTN